MTRTKEQTEAIITALTKLSEKFYADMDKIVNGVEIMPPQDTTSQESKDYWKKHYNN